IRLAGGTRTEADGYRQEFAILFEDILQFVLVEELFGIFVDVQDYIRSALGARALRKYIRGDAIANPTRRLSALLVRKRLDFHFVGHHECRIKTKTETTDDLVGIFSLFEFLNELGSTRKRNLVDVFLHFLTRHPNTAV